MCDQICGAKAKKSTCTFKSKNLFYFINEQCNCIPFSNKGVAVQNITLYTLGILVGLREQRVKFGQ